MPRKVVVASSAAEATPRPTITWFHRLTQAEQVQPTRWAWI
ncbi:MAG: hypothetical protein ACYDD4_09365 [Acidimicrobiales bacterium]